ncbi:hypothetical protein ABZV29_16820 [Streptomyces sp. NPDC005236]|uniref:hypothetical protein n=1 Tax=Streptomyces sp. NPDC005236 TaxID=3157028 RepID=UPI0033ACC488
MDAINWGDAPTWLGAVFAAAAAAAAVWTLKSQRDQIDEQRVFIAEQSATLALERAALLDAAGDRRRAQAETIQWDTTESGMALILTNHGRSPVTDVAMEHPYRPIELCSVWGSETGDSRRADFFGLRLDPTMQPYAVLGSGKQVGCQQPDSSDPVVATFTDDAGVRWRLDQHGKLDEVPPTP